MNRSLCAISTGTEAHMSKHHLSLNGINDIIQVNMVNKLIKELTNDLYRRLSDVGFIFGETENVYCCFIESVNFLISIFDGIVLNYLLIFQQANLWEANLQNVLQVETASSQSFQGT